MVEFDHDLEGQLGVKTAKIGKNWFVHAITFEGCKVWSPNLDIRCIMGRSCMGLYMVEFDLDLQGHLGSKRSKSAKKRACPHNNF